MKNLHKIQIPVKESWWAEYFTKSITSLDFSYGNSTVTTINRPVNSYVYEPSTQDMALETFQAACRVCRRVIYSLHHIDSLDILHDYDTGAHKILGQNR